MYSSITNYNASELFRRRLQALQQKIRSLEISTREEYLAALYSELNAVFSLGDDVTPLIAIPKEGPAKSGDLAANLQRLNFDASAIIGELLGLQNDTARLFSLYAASQNNVRQSVRERVYTPEARDYSEVFISNARLDDSRCYVDYNAGVAGLPLVKETAIVPKALSLGVSTDPNGALQQPLENLLDEKEETSMVFNGSRLELVVEFETPRIINHIQIQADQFEGINLVELVSSADGVLREDILADLPDGYGVIEGVVGKFSGDYIIDFDPRHVKQMKFVFTDRVGKSVIAIRNMSFALRRYSGVGYLMTKKIEAPVGQVVFRAEQHVTSKLTSISHQISFDNVGYQGIHSGDIIDVKGGPYWYRAYFERLDSNFETLSQPINVPGEDPEAATNYSIASIKTIDLGGGVIERSIAFEQVDGTVVLEETPNFGTLTLFEGISVVPVTEYQHSGRLITFSGTRTGITVRYQTSAYARSGLTARKEYYSPYLYNIRFEKV